MSIINLIEAVPTDLVLDTEASEISKLFDEPIDRIVVNRILG